MAKGVEASWFRAGRKQSYDTKSSLFVSDFVAVNDRFAPQRREVSSAATSPY